MRKREIFWKWGFCMANKGTVCGNGELTQKAGSCNADRSNAWSWCFVVRAMTLRHGNSSFILHATFLFGESLWDEAAVNGWEKNQNFENIAISSCISFFSLSIFLVSVCHFEFFQGLELQAQIRNSPRTKQKWPLSKTKLGPSTYCDLSIEGLLSQNK